MDRNTVTGLILIAVIVFTWMFVSKSLEEPEAEKAKTEQVQSSERNDTGVKTPAEEPDRAEEAKATKAALPEDWAQASEGKEEVVTLENDTLIVKISSKGGRVSYVELKSFKTYDGKPLILTDENSSTYNYQFTAGNRLINTEDLYFQPENITKSSVTMVAKNANGSAIRQHYNLRPNSFVVDNKLVLEGFDKVIPMRDLSIDLLWETRTFQHELDSEVSYNNTTVFYRKDGSTDYLSETSDEQEKFKRPTDWVSFKQQFFCQTLIATERPFEYVDISTRTLNDTNHVKDLQATLTLPFDHTPKQEYEMQFYFGPLHYHTLKKMELDLEQQIPLGWSFFLISWINRFIVIPIFNVLNDFIGNYGIIILILTIFIKILVLPLTYRSYLSQAKMRLLKPDLDAIKEKHGGDMAKMQGDQMKLYRQAGVSPFGGCMPLLLQFPILIAMFRFFPSSIELRQESFLWASDLSTYDSIATLPFNIPFYGDHVSLFTILMTISTLIYTKLNSSLSPQQNEFKWIQYIMPVFMLGIFNSYAAGLSLYYLFFNILTFGQQYLFKLFIDDSKLKAQLEANKKKKGNVKKSGFQRRLEEMAKRQQEMRKK